MTARAFAEIGAERIVLTKLDEMTRPGRRFEPDPSDRVLYDQLYGQVYRRMYDRLSPLYRAIQRITGYPPE